MERGGTMDVGSSIRELRQARGFTQEELAAALFVSRGVR